MNKTIIVVLALFLVGAETATLSVNDNATGSPQTGALTGTGTAPLAPVIPTTISFFALALVCDISHHVRAKPTDGCRWGYVGVAFRSHVEGRDSEGEGGPCHTLETARIHHSRQALAAGKFRYRIG